MRAKKSLAEFGRLVLAGLLTLHLSYSLELAAAPLDISQVPLAKSSSAVVLPNLMFILDNSGSMDWDYLPDYVNDGGTCRDVPAFSAKLTFTAASNAVVNAVKVIPGGACTVSDTNLLDGSSTNSSSSTSTVADRINNEDDTGDNWSISDSGSTITVTSSTWTPAQLIGCQLQVTTSSGSLSPLTTTFDYNLTSKACGPGDPPYRSPDFNRISYNPEFVYTPGIKSNGDKYDSQTNLSAVLQDPYTSTSTHNIATSFNETVWCTTSSPTDAQVANASNTSAVCRVSTDDYVYPDFQYIHPLNRDAGPYYFRANITGYCSDSRLTTCIMSTAPSGSYTLPARVRFCKTANDCQEKQNPVTGYVTPNYINIAPADAAFGRIDITSVSEGLSITTIMVGDINIIEGYPVTADSNDTTADIATAVMNAINDAEISPEYRACIGTQVGDNQCSGTPSNRVTIFPQTALGGSTALTGSVPNGRTVSATAPAPANTPTKWTLTFGTASNPVRLTSITIGGASVLSGTYNATTGLATSTKRQTFASLIAAGVVGNGYSGAVDPLNSEQVVITAPAGTGLEENNKAVVLTGSKSAQSNITIGNSGSNAAVALRLNVGATTAVNNTSAANGTNGAGEAAALASAMAGVNGYSTSSASNVLTLYTPVGTTSVATPTVTQTPPSSPGAGASVSFTINGINNSRWTIDFVKINAGGTCAYTDTGGAGVLSSATSPKTNNAATLATQVAAADAGGDDIDVTLSGNILTLTGVNTLAGTTLVGCTVTVRANRQNDDGVSQSITINDVSAGDDNTFNVGAFTGGGSGAISNVVSGAGNPTAFSGGYVGSTSPDFVSSARTTMGTTVGPIALTTDDLANGTDSVKTFQRCDIKANQSCIDGVGRFVGNNGTVVGGRFPRDSKRTDCANTTPGSGYCTYEEEKENFANWYSYSRKRMLAMKTSVGTAFSGIGGNKRIGFITIGNWNSGDGDDSFLPVDDFVGAHRDTWFDRLYSQGTPNATPLRHALSSVGRYFGGKNPYDFTDVDPQQYSCQQNFALLTTDGYWNEAWDSGIKKLDGTTMNNADGVLGIARPYYDGGLGGACGVGSNVSGASSCGTLADVAYHFYTTDLRPAGGPDCTGATVGTDTFDVCGNNVKGSGENGANWQHMTTYTLGLGVDGTLEFQDNYKEATSGDFADIKAGTNNKNWPQVQNLHPTAIDDLWHAAVNGRGDYFSARDKDSLTKSLRDALANMESATGAGAAAATSNLEPTDGDNFSYVASYTTVSWIGNLEARLINVGTGATGVNAIWCVEDVVDDDSDAIICTGTLKNRVQASTDDRAIHMRQSGSLVPFKYDNLTVAQKAMFDPSSLSQYPTLPVESQAYATGATLVDYLRGQWGYEDQGVNAYRIYRDRNKTLGDPVGSQPVYVKKPGFGYSDPGYAGFKTLQTSRAGTVFIGTNDGMLHAFNADSGIERWAYVPTPAMPLMKALADANYRDSHHFFVDGSPLVGDICTANCSNDASAAWKTILVGGYGGGAKGYFALDVTLPDAPVSLWETSDADLGLSYGNPIITKRKNSDGTSTWVVLVTSGYNNIGDGQGYLYVLDAVTGSVLEKIGTGAGDATTPSGLAKIEAYIADANTDNTTTLVYGGDLLGNVWRFNIDEGAVGVVKVATLKDASGNPQEIATRPLVTDLDDADATRYVIVATGKLIEQSDMTDSQVNSLYGFADKFETTGTVGGCAGCTNGARDQLTQESLVVALDEDGEEILTDAGRPTRVAGGVSVAPPESPQIEGCMVDFPISRERVNVDMKLTRGVVSAITNIPAEGECTAGGTSYINNFDYKTCKAIDSYQIGDAIAVGMVVLKLATGFVITATLSNDPTPVLVGEVPPPSGGAASNFSGRRMGWRLLFD